jgi:hypothetical protein
VLGYEQQGCYGRNIKALQGVFSDQSDSTYNKNLRSANHVQWEGTKQVHRRAIGFDFYRLFVGNEIH